MKKNKFVVIAIVIILIIAIVSIIIVNVNINNKNKKTEVLENFISLINDKNYDEMYTFLSEEAKQQISEDDFITRNKNIYEGIDAANIKIDIIEVDENIITYNEELYTSAGEIKFSNEVELKKEENEYKINWSSNMIFPELKDDYKVRVSTIKSKRGDILDRNDNKLAYDGQAYSVGIVPGKLGENKEQDIEKISDLLGVSVDTINNYLSASYVKDDTFVPIKKITKDSELKDSLLEISGVMLSDVDARVYTLGEEAAHLIGYVQAVSAEDLENNEGKGYTSTSLIGKAGLELQYEDKLRGIDGTEIYITNSDGDKVKTLARQEKKDGEDIKLTIDMDIQKNVYNQMKDDKGLMVVMEPQTGELLALVSTPSYDSNDFAIGMTNDKWESINNNEAKPLYNRFAQSYCPGSTFKPITGAIGLTTGTLSENDVFNYSGLSWQKDSSWGDYNITTLMAYSGNKNMKNAIIHSDNIYFAQAALKIGADTLKEGLDKIGFNEQLDFPITLKKSSYLADGNTFTEGKLANTGYGQGDLSVNPILMASIYSAFANEGNMIKPYLIYNDDEKGTIWKEEVFTKEATNIMKEYLIQVVENAEGTATDAKVEGLTIAGKTRYCRIKNI